MSVDGWSRVLVLGGIRSGKSEFAESLVEDAPAVRYVATAVAGPDDPEWVARIEAHQARRPEIWTTEEADSDPSRVVELITNAQPDETLLVDDLGGWVTVLLDPAYQPADDATIGELAAAIQSCAARLVLVSPEVGLSMVPVTPLGRAFADALGSTNQAVADACDAVVLVVAGQPSWLKPGATRPATSLPAQSPGGPARTGPVPAQGGPAREATGSTAPPRPASASTVPATPAVLSPTVTPASAAQPSPGGAWTAPTMMLPMVATGLVIQPGMELPMPDEYAGPAAIDRLATLDLPGAGLGNLDRVVGFAAATQGTTVPAPWRTVRVLLLHGDHDGGAAAGAARGDSARQADQARAGDGPLARLAAENGASLQVVDAPTAAPMEDGPALSEEAVESALRYGWRLAEDAVDVGVQLIVLGACGAGTEAAAAAVLAATAGAEPAAVLGRVTTPGGRVDDAAWMTRCAAVRDALYRTRRSPRGPRDVLAELGGGDVAIATGILLGATARRTPVLLDGPIGVAAGLVSRDLAGQARHWCLLPDHGNHPAVRLAADVLGLTPLLDLRLNLGEGATALATLPLLRCGLTLAGVLRVHPALAEEDGADGPDAAAERPDEADEYIPEPSAPEPADAEPADAEPADAEPADAEPGTPAPTDAEPGLPEPTDAEPGRPEPTDPEPEAPEPPDAEPDDDDGDFAEPRPAGPGPAAPDSSAPTSSQPASADQAAGDNPTGHQAAGDNPTGGPEVGERAGTGRHAADPSDPARDQLGDEAVPRGV